MLTDRRAFFRSLGGALRDDEEEPPPWAPPAAQTADLEALAEECGVRWEHVRALARTSFRLTPAEERTGAYFGGPAALSLDLTLVPGIADSGTLWCSRAGRVTIDDRAPTGRFPLALSHEVMLPRVWAAPAQALDVGEGWEALRARLGIPPPQAMRVFGYPEDKRGDMPGLCEQQAGPGDWQLLLQLPGLFVWVPGPGEISRAVGFGR